VGAQTLDVYLAGLGFALKPGKRTVQHKANI
jgi:hypothetical protein